MNNNPNQVNWQQFLFKATVFTLGVVVLDDFFSEPKDTINYTLYRKGKKIYHGIAYEDRLDARLYEHECAGIIPFDNCIYDHPKTRTQALALERKRIYRDQTPYNCHHK
jgi:hypothetical protein